MYNGASAAFDAAIRQSGQRICSKIILTLANGTVYNLDDGDLIENSLEVSKSAFPNNVFELGGTVAKEISFTLNNQTNRWDNVSFKGAKVVAYSGLYINGTPEYVPLGTFWLDSAGKPLDTINITGADSIIKLEKSYSSSTLTYPATVSQILTEAATKCGVTLSSATIRNGSVSVTKKPDVTKYTFRDILSFVATIAGGFATINRDNELEVKSIARNQYSYNIGKDFRKNSVTDYQISITGLAYYGDLQNILLGTDEYPLILDNNPLIDNMSANDRTAVLTDLYSLYQNFTYVPFTSDFVGDPRVDEGDFIQLLDTRDGNVTTFVFKYRFSHGGFETIEAPACDELDKNFLDSNKEITGNNDTKLEQAWSGSGGGGGGGGGGTLTIDNYPEFSKPVRIYDTKDGPRGTNGSFTIDITLEDDSGNPLNDGEWVLVRSDFDPDGEELPYYQNYEEIIEGHVSGSGAVTRLTSSGHDVVNSAVQLSTTYTHTARSLPIVDLKIYTTDEFALMKKIMEGSDSTYSGSKTSYTPHVWPTLHELSINRLISTGDHFGSVSLNITVSMAEINFADSYYNVRENQLARALWVLGRYCLGSTAQTEFKKHFVHLKDVEDFVRMFRMPIDNENWSWNSGGDTPSETWTPPSYLNVEMLDYFDSSGGYLSVELRQDRDTFTVSLQGDAYDGQGNFLWKDEYLANFWPIPLVQSVTQGQRTFVETHTYTTITKPTTIVKIPFSVASSVTENLYDATSTPPTQNPWKDVLTYLVIEYSEKYEYETSQGTMTDFACWCHIEGTTSPYQYINDSLNFEISNVQSASPTPDPDPEPSGTSFTNPLPTITSAEWEGSSDQFNSNLLRIIYTYNSVMDTVELSYSFTDYNTWETITSYVYVSLDDVTTASSTSFSKTITDTVNTNQLNLTAVTLSYDTTNNQITLSQTTSGTSDSALNTMLASSRILTNNS